MNKEPPPLYCSFCGKRQDEVPVIIAGPTVFICNECVELCTDIIREKMQMSAGEREYQSWFGEG